MLNINTTFTSRLQFKKNSCGLNKESGVDIPYNYVNIYVKITSNCNAKCNFCVYRNSLHDTKEQFDFIKFENMLLLLEAEDIRIHKVSFTGGEPSMYCDRLAKCLNSIAKLKYKPFIVVNSNGFRLNLLQQFKEIDSISLSRHALTDISNCSIFGTLSVAKTEDIKQNVNGKIHLTCNLIKGRVDSEKNIIAYLEKAASLGIYDVGFVSLMKVNDFCVNNHVDFDDIEFKNPAIVCNKEWTYLDICKCKNFIYLPEEGTRVVKFYSRYRCKNGADAESNYVFDGNYLRSNFEGSIIY